MAWLATRDRDESLDLVQDAMYKLVQKYLHLDVEQWNLLFFKILNNRILDWHRGKKIRGLFGVFSAQEENEEDNEIEQFADFDQLRPDRLLERVQQAEKIEKAIANLPIRQQQAVVLRLWEGFDVSQTADIMGCSQGSVKTHLHRATVTLQNILGDEHHD